MQSPRPRQGFSAQKSQGWTLQASFARGLRPGQALWLAWTPAPSTHITTRVRLPPPQGAEQAPQADTHHEKEAQGAVLQVIVVGSGAAGQASGGAGLPSALTQEAMRVATPPPHVALHALQAVYWNRGASAPQSVLFYR